MLCSTAVVDSLMRWLNTGVWYLMLKVSKILSVQVFWRVVGVLHNHQCYLDEVED